MYEADVISLSEMKVNDPLQCMQWGNHWNFLKLLYYSSLGIVLQNGANTTTHLPGGRNSYKGKELTRDLKIAWYIPCFYEFFLIFKLF